MLNDLRKQLSGPLLRDNKTLEKYSHDTSLFEITPRAVLFPKNSLDVKKTVKFVSQHKKDYPNLSITARSGGTDMSGGAINDSLIMVFEKYMNHIGRFEGNTIVVEPGVYYRNMEKKTITRDLIMPSYPASREIAAVGGMAANRAGGEKSLIYGTTERYVERLKVVLSDGNQYEFKPLDRKQLDKKLKQKDFEGEFYRKVFKIVDENYDFIKANRPPVSKNVTGYALWDIWDRERQIFDLTKLFVGSQGTLGLITEIEFSLVPVKKYTGLLIGYIPTMNNLGQLINTVLEHKPANFETFDDHTLKFAFRFFWQFHKSLGWWKFIKLAFSLIPDALILARDIARDRHLPKLVILVNYEEDSQELVDSKLYTLRQDLKAKKFKMDIELAPSKQRSQRFWLMRRESFNLLRKNVKGSVHTAPFIDDLVVPPQHLPAFLPEFIKLLDSYKLLYTIAGHMGDGNFHVIPLMDFNDQTELAKIEPALKQAIALVKKYQGSMSGEHNDGLIRGPFLKQMYGPKMFSLFRQVKNLFDPQNIFNPHKKTDASWEYSKKHMRKGF